MKRKIILVAAICCMSVAGFSQAGLGLRAGVNFQNLNGEDAAGNKLEYDLKPGFHVGLTADVPVAPDYYVQPGLLFSTKGAKVDLGTTDYKLNLSYVEVPINFIYKPVLGTGRLLVGIGPYFGFGVGGKYKGEGTDVDVDWGEDIKRFDAGGNLLFGYEFGNKLSAQLNAQLGLVNIGVEDAGDSKVKNTGFGVSLGYRLR